MPTDRSSLHCAAAALLALALVLSACGSAAPQSAAAPAAPTASATNTPAPTATPPPPTPEPSPTPLPTLAEGVYVAGVDVGGLDIEAARAELEQALAPLLRPLEVRVGDHELLVRPDEIGLELGLDNMLDEALAAKSATRIPLAVEYDEELLRSKLEALAEELGTPGEVSVLKDTEPISRSFVLQGGEQLDIDAAIEQIDRRLRSVGGVRRITLAPAPGAGGRPAPELLQQQIEEMAEEWKGVAGIYVYDLASGQPIAALNEGTVFSAASTIKTAIMLHAYAYVEEFTPRQKQALEKMIVESDNLDANLLLAAAVGGGGTEEALAGAEQMSEMLAELGLKNTYQWVPFEALDYINLHKLKYRCGPKGPVGPKPHTDTGCALRTTPAEMAQLYLMIEQCSHGEGVLPEKFPETLTAERCQEMIDWLEKNGDTKRMVAGLPPGTRVAHKSGWIADMQADVGIVRSPGGDYIAAIYLYRPVAPSDAPVPDRIMMQSIAGFSRLIYTYYNPVPAAE